MTINLKLKINIIRPQFLSMGRIGKEVTFLPTALHAIRGRQYQQAQSRKFMGGMNRRRESGAGEGIRTSISDLFFTFFLKKNIICTALLHLHLF